MNVTKEQVSNALDDLEKGLPFDDDISKASETDLDQAEGSDFDGKNKNMKGKKKMSDDAPGPDKSPKAAKKSFSDEGESDETTTKGMKYKADDGGDMDYDEEEEDDMDKSKKAKKSFADEMPDEIQTKIDVSEFLKSLVNHTAESVDALREYVAKSDIAHETRYGDMVEAIEDVQKSQAKIGVVLKAVCEKIGIIEKSPARQPKAETNISKSQVADRQFENPRAEGDEPVQEKMFKSLSANPREAKLQMSNALCDLVKSGDASDLDVIGFESGGYIRPELVTKLQETL